MRLVCPNCGAQYEVDDRVVPEGGRDVQCSACGHGWYQMPHGHEEEQVSEETALDDEALAADEAEDESEEAVEEPSEEFEEAEEEAQAAEEAEPFEVELDEEPFDIAGLEREAAETMGESEEPTDTEAEDEEPAEEPAELKPAPRPLDDGVKSILQEEAQRELDARASEVERAPEAVETQPDLGLDDTGPSPEEERRRIARERMARMRGIEEDELAEADFDANVEPTDAAGQAPHGSALFPDIEEINSTLDSHAPAEGDTIPETAEAVAAARSGFGRSFTVVIVLAALLLAVYVLAPKLATSVPALEPALSAYVDAVNTARAYLEDLVRGLLEKVKAAAENEG